ncbi:TIGR01620 family protein [Gallaecimonas kandeliae]|uniref:TIGR01620 family protein n=1 Tax=Gallaecimonas kandeliae TaxID=3029055 RepID=UPI002649CFB5|nr:TIGR01620 family protein [Gallaecimonas kandeliae]WKE64123.1 TIGR01620 family protein [Gallaecimonas kandeliae]
MSLRPSRLVEEEEVLPELRQAVELSDASFTPEEPSAAEQGLERALAPRRRPWLAWGLCFLTLGVFGQTGYWLYDLWQSTPALALLFSLATVLLGAGALRALWREWRALARLKRLERDADKAAKASTGDGALTHIERSMKLRGLDKGADMQSFLATLSSHDSGEEVQQRFRQQVLVSLDDRAQALVRRYALEATVLVAVSPLALTDMAIIAWRNLRLIRDIAKVYGLPLGYWSRVRLVRQVFINLIYAGASELVVDIGMSTLGADLLGKLSGRAAQGLGAGLLTARLGWQAMRLSRPLPMDEAERQRLSKARSRLIVDMGKDLMKLPGMVLGRSKEKLPRED